MRTRPRTTRPGPSATSRDPAPLLLRLVERHSRRATSRGARLVATSAGFAISALLAALDFATGPALSFDAFYVLVVATFTVMAGARVGFGVAAFTAVAWTASDALLAELRLGVWGSAWNVLGRLAALAMVALLVATLLRAVEAERAAAHQSGEFLAMAAHQLRTPVAALRASVEAVVHAPAGEAQGEALANAMSESARLGRLVSALLRVARLDQGELPRTEEVALEPLVAAEVARMRSLSRLRFSVDVHDGVPATVHVDATATADALANLLDNARRHAVARVAVEVFVTGEHVAVAVEDDGPGLPAGAEERAFERFVTLARSGGSGLGLPIARTLARQQGGDLVYEAKRFLLLIPGHPRQARGGHSRGPRT